MLTNAGGALLAFRMFCSAVNPPKVDVFAHEANSMAALGAAALAYSASRVASASSPFTFGSIQLLGPFAGAGCTCVSDPPVYDERPKTDRNVVQSDAL